MDIFEINNAVKQRKHAILHFDIMKDHINSKSLKIQINITRRPKQINKYSSG